MNHILSPFSASISELKKNPSALIMESGGLPIAVMNHNKPTAYLIPAATFEKLMDSIDDAELAKVSMKRMTDIKKAVDVSLDDL